MFYSKFGGGFMTKEQFFNCAYCGELISVILELSETSQQYIEDCEVCCRPMQIHATTSNDGSVSVSVRDEDSA